MKKIVLLTIFLCVSMTLIGCSDMSSPNARIITESEILEIEQMIKDALPQKINNDFDLPQFEDVFLTYHFEGRIFINKFIYTSPFFDKQSILNVQIKSGSQIKTLDFIVNLLAYESGANENQIHISIPVAVHQIHKEIYTDAFISVAAKQNDVSKVVHQTNEAQIRGRGNSTWGMPKKPYRIRFKEDTQILGMPAARNYVLLAEYADKSLMRNTLTYKFSSLLEHIEYTVQTRYVELFINEEYQGLYVLTEHIEIHENKLNVSFSYDTFNTGYFLELDQRMFQSGIPAGKEWFNLYGYAYDIKRPNPTHANYTQAHTDYILNYLFEMEQALITQKNYELYLDLDNFIDFFITHELFKNVDVGFSSVFFYKRMGEPLKMGPLWDFDLSMGNADYIDYGPTNFYGFAQNKNRWFHLMMNIPEVRIAFRDRYNELYEDVIPRLLFLVKPLSDSIEPLANTNFDKWQILSHYVWPNPRGMVEATTYRGQVNYVYDYINDRSFWMYQTLNTQEFINGFYT